MRNINSVTDQEVHETIKGIMSDVYIQLERLKNHNSDITTDEFKILFYNLAIVLSKTIMHCEKLDIDVEVLSSIGKYILNGIPKEFESGYKEAEKRINRHKHSMLYYGEIGGYDQ